MIYPTRAAILLAATGAPVALVIGALVPGRWYLGLAWPLAVLVGCLLDALGGQQAARIAVALPATAHIGETIDARVSVAVAGARQPARAEVALAPDPLLGLENDGRAWLALANGRGAASLPVATRRRGTARVTRLWVRWQGPLGLAWHQHSTASDAAMAILPDLALARRRGPELIRRHALEGLLSQNERGEGTDFDALVEFRPGMDRRAIDWKQSARHGKLDAKEYHTEKNNQIVFAIDAGRQMAEPVDGLPRIDRLVAAALLTAFVALKLGDRVALHAFDSRPRLASGLVGGASAFAQVQHLAARIDYSDNETNYTLALTSVNEKLNRRSLIVLLTEVVDTTAADHLVRAAALLARTHLLLVVVLRDDELEAAADRRPDSADDVVRAVTAAQLLRDRAVVLTRLRHLGAHVIEAPHGAVGERLVQGYVDLKRRNLL